MGITQWDRNVPLRPANSAGQFYFQPARPPHTTPPVYHITKPTSSQVTNLLQIVTKVLQFCYNSINSSAPLRARRRRLVKYLMHVKYVYCIQAASWISCAIGSCVGELGNRATKFYEYIYIEAGLASGSPTKNPIATSCAILDAIENPGSWEEPFLRRRHFLPSHTEKLEIKKFFTRQIFDFYLNFIYNIYVRRKELDAMRRAYVVYGTTDDRVDTYYAICHSMIRADELCFEAEASDTDGRIYSWVEVIEEDD